MTKDEMIEWFKSGRPEDRAPHWGFVLTRCCWGALIEAEREPPDEYLDVLGLTR
jgi:hypothetical protein